MLSLANDMSERFGRSKIHEIDSVRCLEFRKLVGKRFERGLRRIVF